MVAISSLHKIRSFGRDFIYKVVDQFQNRLQCNWNIRGSICGGDGFGLIIRTDADGISKTVVAVG